MNQANIIFNRLILQTLNLFGFKVSPYFKSQITSCFRHFCFIFISYFKVCKIYHISIVSGKFTCDVCEVPSRVTFLCLFLNILFIFRERGREGEREGEKYQCVVASQSAPTGDLACNPGMCTDWELNQQPFGFQPELSPLS